MGKRDLSEEDIKARYITPAITDAGWDIKKQVRLEYAFTAGRIILRGNITARGKKKRADYVLFYKNNFPIAVIEAKDNNHAVGAGLQQAITYAKALDINYVYASNGDGFVEQNLITGEVKEISLDAFPSPDTLYKRYLKDKNVNETEEKVLLEPCFQRTCKNRFYSMQFKASLLSREQKKERQRSSINKYKRKKHD